MIVNQDGIDYNKIRFCEPMRRFQILLLVCFFTPPIWAGSPQCPEPFFTNRPPLQQKAYYELPIGNIHPREWLRQQLELMRDGLTGDLDERMTAMGGTNNCWLGGNVEGIKAFEGTSYWMDGLVPLAYILKDEKLIAKARTYIEWAFSHQQASGYFGPTGQEDCWERLPSFRFWNNRGSGGSERVAMVQSSGKRPPAAPRLRPRICERRMKTSVNTGEVSLLPAHEAGLGVKVRAKHGGGSEIQGFCFEKRFAKPSDRRFFFILIIRSSDHHNLSTESMAAHESRLGTKPGSRI